MSIHRVLQDEPAVTESPEQDPVALTVRSNAEAKVQEAAHEVRILD